MVGLVFAVVVANGCSGGKAFPEEPAQLGEQGFVDRLTMKGGCRHGGRRKYRKPTFKDYSAPEVAATRMHKRSSQSTPRAALSNHRRNTTFLEIAVASLGRS